MFSGSGNMEKHLFNLKFAAKNLERQSKKCEKEEKAEKLKLKRAIQKGNMEGARIHAENSIRQKNQALNFLRMGSRVDAVAQRVQTAVTMKQVTGSMAGVVKSMDSALRSMNLEKIFQLDVYGFADASYTAFGKVSALMEKFEKQFEDLDVQTGYMENAMSDTTTLTVPEGQVESLMHQVADEHGLELNMELPEGQQGQIGTASAATNASQEQDELSQRLAKLRQS